MKRQLKSVVTALSNAPFFDRIAQRDPSLPLVRVPPRLKVEGPTRLVLHVGAHKTGTSSLQTMLRRAGDQLAEQGVFAFARHIPRTPWSTVPSGRRGYDLKIRPWLDAMLHSTEESPEFRRAAAALASSLENLAAGAPTILYSDEALMGKRLKNHNGMYPQVEKQIRGLMEAFPDRHVSVILYIREQSGFVESCYIQSVKEGNACASFEQFLRKRVDFDKLSWMDLADRISSVVGEDALTVERFERIKEGGFVPFAQRFLSRFASTDEIRVQDIHANPSLSAKGVKLSLAIRRHVSDKRWNRYKNLLAHDFPSGPTDPAPKLLSEEQKRMLRSRYAGDCDAAEAKYTGGRTRSQIGQAHS